MGDGLKVTGILVGMILFVTGMTWTIQGNDFFMYKYFGPKYEGARREIFEQTKAYRQGTIQDIQHMMLQYNEADDKGKQAIASVVLQRTADFPMDEAPANIREFVYTLQHQRGLR